MAAFQQPLVEGFEMPAPAPAELDDGVLKELSGELVGHGDIFAITEVSAMLAKRAFNRTRGFYLPLPNGDAFTTFSAFKNHKGDFFPGYVDKFKLHGNPFTGTVNIFSNDNIKNCQAEVAFFISTKFLKSRRVP